MLILPASPVMLQWSVMQLLVDFFPLLLFFAAYLWQGIYVATGVAIAASIVQIAWIHWKHGRAGVTHWLCWRSFWCSAA